MNRSLTELVKHIGKFLATSTEGYGIFNRDDNLLGCNQAFATLFGSSPNKFIHLHFSDIIRHAFSTQKGIKIDSDDIEEWLAMAMTKRRSQEFRVFEIDLLDGRWFLVSEQILASGEMLFQARDITAQKNIEFKLSAKSSKLRTLALTDELTQIANRRSFIESVNAEISRCSRIKANMAFLVLDIDYFKHVNDTYGHQAGDTVLISMSQLIKTLLRDYDTFGRLGGEEFGIFLSETDSQTAVEVAERIRTKIMQHKIAVEGHDITITVSIGIAIPAALVKFESIYKRADVALYQAKNSGRNKVILGQ
ncbi:diguanylate cyclase [Paraglaciecola sp. 25GB23A]|uniref:sensor domain-containing diguanylate cyclase n=1 Tax=Paraglaciecola sp. 25GB23A TaxID=3156068 RepID=UPI0032AED018